MLNEIFHHLRILKFMMSENRTKCVSALNGSVNAAVYLHTILSLFLYLSLSLAP